MLQNNQWVKDKIKTYLEKNENENNNHTAKAVIRGKCTQHYRPTSRSRKKSQINNLKSTPKETLKKKEQTEPKVSRRKEIIKIKEEINEIETRRTIEKINEIKSWFFEKKF